MSEPQPTARLAVQKAVGTAFFKVAAVEPLAEGTEAVTVIAGEWLHMGAHAPTFIDVDVRAASNYGAYGVQSGIEEKKFVGMFTGEQ